MSLLSTNYHYGLVCYIFKISTALGLLLFASLFSACNEVATNSTSPSQTAASTAGSRENYVTATPNPIPAGSGAGTTTISWRTTNLPPDQIHIFVAKPDGTEDLFSTGSEGSETVPWITADAPVEFRLYNGTGENRKLLDKTTVIRNK